MRTILITLAMLLVLPLRTALAANPALMAHVQGINDPKKSSTALRLAELTLELDMVGALSETTLTARFANPSESVLEGDFSFELPADAVVTGYALDIEGQLVDGVLVEPLKAERTYEEQVRQGIDPGVAKVSRANIFSTRIFPIPAEGSRIIRLKFAAPVHPQRGLVFPLLTESEVGEFQVKLRGSSLSKAPVLTLPDKMPVGWQRGPEGFTAEARLVGAALTGELRIAPLHPMLPAIASRHANGERRVHVVDSTARAVTRGATGRRLRVYWDRSLSRRDQQLADERSILAKYLAQSKPASIDLVLFNSSGARVRRVTAAELDATLREVTYRGGTSFAVLQKLSAPSADVCVVFSDGVATIDARRDFDPGCEVFAITSAADADRAFLRRLTGGASSAVLQLGRQDEKEILARLAGGGLRVVQARSEDGRTLRFTSLDGGASGWSIITEEPVAGDIILRIAGLGHELVERRYRTALTRKARFDGAGALWAADRAAALAAEDGAHEEFVALSRQFSVASPGMSFLVLEDAQDYVNVEISPPENLPEEMLEEYRELKAQHDRQRKDDESQRLATIMQRWKEVTGWWDTKFDQKAPKKIAEKGPVPAIPATANAPAARAAEGTVDSITAEDIGRFPDPNASEALQRIVVTGFRRSLNASMDVKRNAIGVIDSSSIGIELGKWDLKRPYIEALDAAAAADVDRVFTEQEHQYGQLPVFYFDVAEWLYRHEREADAREMLLSALELPVANEETAAMVAERLQRYGSLDRAVWLMERAAEQSDYLPQTRRALALALAKRAGTVTDQRARADLERAVRLLNEVIMSPWSGSYDGIEVVSLMEANELLPRLEKLGVTEVPLDERLRALLDVDLRVVIEWNTAATDMDLWVDEPNGERAIYSNPLTAIGGRLSNDMTNGFGPEEYLLRRAAKGEYRISVDVYSADRINPNGSTVVTARLFRDYGRPTQREQTMEIELKPEDSGEKFIGTFKVL